MHAALVTLALALSAAARPARFVRRADFTLKNGQDAIALNDKFKTLTTDSPCNAGDNACVNQEFAQCVGGKFVLQPCGGGICAALPLVNSAGTSITCTTQADLDARIAATGATANAAPAADPPASSAAAAPPAASSAAAAPPPADAGNNAASGGNGGDLQKSNQLDPSVVCSGFADDGQNPPVTGQTASMTSTNNFINFCAITIGNTPLTNGAQITTGSCNPTPIGLIPSVDNMPSAKVNFPKNLDVINANVAFNASLNMRNIQTGKFTNAQKTYFGAPQQLNDKGQIIGHTHIVIEQLTDLSQITPTDPKKFMFFKGVDAPADQNNEAIALVAAGVPAGAYRICSINTSMNHSPVFAPIAQHGALDDCSYFTAK